jgi:surface polysaccharide O-acyltransferase-like enzyme
MTSDVIDTTTFPPTTVVRASFLDVLRIAAVAGVVAIHVFGGIVVNTGIHGTPTWWAAVIVDIGNVWVVPAFVMVSGALLLAPRSQGAGPASFYRRRLLRLGPAFVFWQLFYLVVARIWITGQHLSLREALALIADGNTYTHLYFLWLIIGLYAVAPVIYPFLAQGGRRRAMITAFVLLAVMVAAYTAAAVLTHLGIPRSIRLTAFTQWLPYVGFFVAGIALMGLKATRARILLVASVGVLALVAIVLEFGMTAPDSIVRAVLPLGYPTLLTGVATLALFLTVQHLLGGWVPTGRRAALLRSLSDAAFGVFLIHFVIMLLIRLVFPAVIEPQRNSFWAALGIWVCVTVISFALTMGMRRLPYVRRLV